MIVYVAEFIFNDHFSGCHKEIIHYLKKDHFYKWDK